MAKSKAPNSPPPPDVVGAKLYGVTEQVAVEIGRKVQSLYKESGRVARLKTMRFIPSTWTELNDGAFQVIANTTVEIVGAGGAPRPETVNSVVTFRKADGAEKLQSLSIPALEHTAP